MSEEEKEKLLQAFAEFCHEHYKGSFPDEEHVDRFIYGYDDEVIYLASKFLGLTEGKKLY